MLVNNLKTNSSKGTKTNSANKPIIINNTRTIPRMPASAKYPRLLVKRLPLARQTGDWAVSSSGGQVGIPNQYPCKSVAATRTMPVDSAHRIESRLAQYYSQPAFAAGAVSCEKLFHCLNLLNDTGTY